MTRMAQIEVFTFSELSESAKDTARHPFRCESFDSSEFEDSANAFAEISPIKITQWDSCHGTVDFEWTDSEDIAEMSGLRAWKWLLNNNWFSWAHDASQGDCPLTGVFSDSCFGDAIEQYEKNPLGTPSLEQVFYEAAQAWVQGMREEWEYQRSDEYIDELIKGNEYKFTKEGEFF